MITLPHPPSVNAMFRNVRGRGRAKTDRYKVWLNAAGWDIKAQRPERIAGPVAIDITVQRRNRNSDIDNLIKPILDLLVTHGVIDDDKHVNEVRARWGEVTGCEVRYWAAE